MKKNLAFALVTLLAMSSVISCSNTTEPEQKNDTSTEVPAVFKNFYSSVKISRDGDYVVLQSDDVPDHPSTYFSTSDSRYQAYTGSNPNYFRAMGDIITQSQTLRIPANPQAATTHQNTMLGPIGVALNGVALFNQYNGANAPLGVELDTFDQYNGHPTPTGYYHYHIEPIYMTAKNGKAALIGFLLDGFPVYGPMENGNTVVSSNLDQYHGHSHATTEYPNGIYHYHITDDAPYINGGQYYGTPGTTTR